MRPSLLPVLVALLPLAAAAQSPEIKREPGASQGTGVAHTLRTIPEACVRLEGTFTGQADELRRTAGE